MDIYTKANVFLTILELITSDLTPECTKTSLLPLAYRLGRELRDDRRTLEARRTCTAAVRPCAGGWVAKRERGRGQTAI